MRLFGKPRGRDRDQQAVRANVPFEAPLAPEEAFFAIGDVHGCLRPLGNLLLEIDKRDSAPKIVCLGDMIDRGEHSAGVLQLLFAMSREMGDRFVCLRGNHEEMMLRYLEDPERQESRWLGHGGLQTLASFGVSRSGKRDPEGLRDRLLYAMGDDMLEWLQGLPSRWQTGNVTTVHAAADPALPMDFQSTQVLTWGHPDFFRVNRDDGIWVVHGHTITEDAKAEDGRISVDTGAYLSGRLTAAHVYPGGVDFIQT